MSARVRMQRFGVWLQTVLITTVILIPLDSPRSHAETPAVFYVSQADGDDASDGLEPENDGAHGPKQTIGAAIVQARSGDTIVVVPGTYEEALDFQGKDLILTSNQPEDSECIRTTVIRAHGDWESPATAVTFSRGETRAAVIRGFTVTTTTEGRGIFCTNGASPTIQGNRIIDNWGCLDGGGIQSDNASPLIVGNTIVSNGSEWCGAIYASGGEPVIKGNLIAGNSAGMCGAGGMMLHNSTAVIDGNTIVGNFGGDEMMDPVSTGGIGVTRGTATVTDCIIWDNSASWGSTPSQMRVDNGTITTYCSQSTY